MTPSLVLSDIPFTFANTGEKREEALRLTRCGK